MQFSYLVMRARWWPGAASLLGLLAAHSGHAQATLNNPVGSTFNQVGSLYNAGTVRNAGTYLPTSGTLLVAGGDFINTGTIGTGPAAGTVKLVETAPGTGHTLALGGAALPNLELDVPAGTTLASSGTLLGALTLRNGHLRTGPGAVLTLGPTATLAGETDAHYVQGRVTQARSLSIGSLIDFGGMGVSLDPAGTSFALTIERRAGLNEAGVSYGVNPNMPSQQGIDRVWALSSPLTTLALPAILTLSWPAAEDHGHTFAGTNAQVWRSDDGGTNWVMHGPAQNGAGHSVVVATTRLNALYTVSTSAAPLPVTLTSFAAQLSGPDAVALTWGTASEANTDRFEIERSTDGRSFTRLAQVAAHGTSATAQAYAHRDAALPNDAATLYYRLRIVDHDHSALYSPVRTVTAPTSRLAELAISVAPNPAVASGPASLWVISPAPATGTLTVLNALGQVLSTRPATLAEGPQQVPLALQGLPAGVYTLRLQTGGRVATTRLLLR